MLRVAAQLFEQLLNLLDPRLNPRAVAQIHIDDIARRLLRLRKLIAPVALILLVGGHIVFGRRGNRLAGVNLIG